MQTFSFRLKPGQYLLEEIARLSLQHNIQAGCILCAVGSLTHATLRLANREDASEFDGHFEIVSLTGTISTHGSHLHISIADENGCTIGGHLLAGCKIYTTAELVLASFPELIYQRELCELSGYEELVVQPNSKISQAP